MDDMSECCIHCGISDYCTSERGGLLSQTGRVLLVTYKKKKASQVNKEVYLPRLQDRERGRGVCV